MNELALFAGAGGGILASRLLGWRTIAGVEIDPRPRAMLHQRQRDAVLEDFPVWDDIRTFEPEPFRGHVDVISGGFPCQDISAAGKGAGLAGSRSGLWFEYLRCVESIRPSFVFSENSPLLRTRGLGAIVHGLTGLGYDVRWGVLGAGHFGAFHKRARMWVVANTKRHIESREEPCGRETRRMGRVVKRVPWNERWPDALSRFRGVSDGLARVVDRTDAIRNGQVPIVAATAWRVLTSDLGI